MGIDDPPCGGVASQRDSGWTLVSLAAHYLSILPLPREAPRMATGLSQPTWLLGIGDLPGVAGSTPSPGVGHTTSFWRNFPSPSHGNPFQVCWKCLFLTGVQVAEGREWEDRNFWTPLCFWKGLLLTTDTTRLHLLYLLQHDGGGGCYWGERESQGGGGGGVFSLSI